MSPRIIALLTDFGAGDPYVAAMKGVIHSRRRNAVITDVTHDVPRHDLRAAAYALHSVEPYFPSGTIFVCVVDPGVGTGRPILLLERGGRTIIAPGNGLLEMIATGARGERWYELRVQKGQRKISPTFHGRDLFAPAAARLAGGARLRDVGTPIAPLRAQSLFVEAPVKGSSVRGSVLHLDRFGNVITNVRVQETVPGRWSARIGGRTVKGPYRTYEEAPRGAPFLIRGSSGLLEISVRRGDAATFLRVAPGTTMTFRIV